MKKYIAPVAKQIMLDAEFNLMMTASEGETQLPGMMSNQFQTDPTDGIWGSDED